MAYGRTGGRAAADGNALARITRDIRRTAHHWRHGHAVAAFADGRREVLAAYGELRERTRAEGDAAALGTAFRDTLNRHGALLKQAEAFRARPAAFASLLAENGGMGPKDLDAFEALHVRASRHRRAATMRQVHRVKQEAEQAPARHPEPRVKAARTPEDGAVAPEPGNTGPGKPHWRKHPNSASGGRMKRFTSSPGCGRPCMTRAPTRKRGSRGRTRRLCPPRDRKARNARGKGERNPQPVQGPRQEFVAVLRFSKIHDLPRRPHR